MAEDKSVAQGAAAGGTASGAGPSTAGNLQSAGLVSSEARFAAGLPDPLPDDGSASHDKANSDPAPQSGKSGGDGSGNPDAGAAANAGTVATGKADGSEAQGANADGKKPDDMPEPLKSVLSRFDWLKPIDAQAAAGGTAVGQAGQEPETSSEPPKLSEAAMRQINPDGKATPEQQLRNALNLAANQEVALGRLGQQLGEFKKVYQTLIESGLFRRDERGVITGLSFTKAADIYGADVEAINRELAERGLKLVEVNGNGDASNGGPSAEDAIINELVPDDPHTKPEDRLTVDEKWERIIGNKSLHRAYLQKVHAAEKAAAAAELQRAMAAEQEQAQAKARRDELAKSVKDFDRYVPAMRAYNARLASMRGPEIVDVLLKLALADDLPRLQREAFDAGVAYSSVKTKELDAAMLPDIGGGVSGGVGGGNGDGLVSEAARIAAGIPV